MRKKEITWFIGSMSIFFYAMSWFVRQYGETAWYIGIGLPWLSLFAGILISFFCDFVLRIRIPDIKIGWGHLYAFCSILYVIVMSIIAKNVIPFIPHLAACVCFIVEVYIENLYHASDKREKEIKEATDFLESKLESIDKLVLEINESKEIKKMLETVFVQTAESYKTLSKIIGEQK